MPWNEVDLMSQRLKLVEKMLLPGANIKAICIEHNVSRKTAYKWLNRYLQYGLQGILNENKAPKNSPNKTPKSIEDFIITAHKKFPYWGPRKLKNYLLNEKVGMELPSPPTISRILERHGYEVIKNNKSTPATTRFEKCHPNDMWQMDFKGSFMTDRHRCYPLTVIDDHSRYNVGLSACHNEQSLTVKSQLIMIFKEYGLPVHINVDNGNPWGTASGEGITQLQVWLIRLGIRLTHSQPYHPQTNGKIERFHRTLKLEVLHKKKYKDCSTIQSVFNDWRHEYNFCRPHEALNGKPPASRYRVSERKYTGKLITPDYDDGDVVRKVSRGTGLLSFQGKQYNAGKGLGGEYVTIRETDEIGEYSIFFMDTYVRKLSLKDAVD